MRWQENGENSITKRFMICKVEEDEMSGACSMNGSEEDRI
jgi:hypothetical protein